MPVSTPSLASHVVPIPYLSPHWGALLEGQDESVLPNPKDIVDIFSEVEPLNICLNERGLELSKRVGKESHEIWRLLEAQEPGIMENMYLHHVDQGDHKQPTGAKSSQNKSGEKRKLVAKFGAKKAQKTGEVYLPDSWRMEEEIGGSHEVPATQKLTELLMQVLEDESLGQYWEDILDDIKVETQKVRAKAMLSHVKEDLIKAVLARMQGAVQDFIQSGRMSSDDNGAEMCLAVVDAALGFLSEEAVGPAVYNNELLETIVDFIDGFINRNIVPALQKALKERLALENESATGKRRKSREHTKGVQGNLKRKVDLISHVVLVLGDVLRLNVKVPDPQCISLSRICLGTFFVDFSAAVYKLQQACVELMQSLFARYPDYREHIMQEIAVHAVSFKPVPKDFCFQLKAPKLGQIQMVSALLLSLFQSCCDDKQPSRPDPTSEEQSKHPALMLLVLFIKNVQLKMNVKKEKGGESGYKLLLQSLVADVCWVLGAPEWPIAPLCLKALWKYAYDMCTKESVLSQYRLDAAKLVGDIVVCIKQLALTAKAPELAMLGGRSVASVASQSIQDNPVLYQLSGQQLEILRRHSSTVEQSPIKYALSLDQTEGFAVDDEQKQKDYSLAQKLVSQQLLLNYLVVRSTRDEGLRHAKQNFIFMWCTDNNPMPPHTERCYQWFWNDANYLAHKKIDGLLDPSAQEALSFASFLCASSNLIGDFKEILKPLIALLKHPKMPQFRQRALKALSQIIELDPGMLGDDVMRDAVCCSMTDQAKSVRAEAVTLVGKFMCTREQLTLQYYESICQRCRDSGSSVRKAAMNIVRDLLTKSKAKCVIERACVAIIPLLKDESEDICKRTFAFLREMWFPSSISEKDSVHTALSVAARFDQMRSVIDAAYKANSLIGRDSLSVTDILEDFMKETLKTKKETVRECEQYCQEALQAIIRSQEGAISTLAGNGTEDPDANLLSLFRTLALLVRVRPDLFVKDVELLCKFLSSQQRGGGQWSKGQCEMIGTVAAIYDCVLPYVQDPPDYLIRYLQQDLPKLIQYAPNMQLMTISIKCLCTMVKSVGSTRRRAPAMHKVLQACFTHEVLRLKDPKYTAKPRCLIIAGLFCRFSDFNLHLDNGKVLAIEDSKVREIFDMSIKQYVSHEHTAFKRAGFSCLGSLFVRIPRFILMKEAQRVLSEGLEHTNEDIRAMAVSALSDFVGEDVSDSDATSLRNSTMQTFLDRILKCVYCEKEETAAAALRLVSTIHDRGQVHPQLCIPDMIAVQQRGVTCSGIGYQVLKLINEKYPDYNSAQVFVQGIIKAFDHKRKDALIATDNFVRAFELRLPNKKYVMQNIQAIVDKVKRGPDKAELSAAISGGGGGSSSSSWQVILDDVDRKCFLLAVASVLPFPDQECAQQMITQAANVGIKMGSETKIHLKSAIEERESFGKTSLDKKAYQHMYDAARACLLLDLRRFLQIAYCGKKDKTDFPAEIPVPLQPENILRTQHTGCVGGESEQPDILLQVYTKLKISLRMAAEDKAAAEDGTFSVAKKGRGRPQQKTPNPKTPKNKMTPALDKSWSGKRDMDEEEDSFSGSDSDHSDMGFEQDFDEMEDL